MRFRQVLVVGAGQMGSGIAQVVAGSGRRVSLHDAAPGAVERGLETMRKSLTRLAEKGGPDPDEVLARVETVEDLAPADLMIEAVVEDAAIKKDVFGRADSVLPAESILASNTSSIPISSLAAATSRPERVIGMHFFNPVPVLELVEIVRGRETSDETAAAITDLAKELGKTPAVANDFPGFARRRRRGRGDRHDREAGLQSPARTARPGRPDRPRHVRRDHGSSARRARRYAVFALSPAQRTGECREIGPQVWCRFLHL